MPDGRRRPDGDDDDGVVLGTWTGGGQLDTGVSARRCSVAAPRERRRSSSTARSRNAAASLAGLEIGLRGPKTTLSHKEASGLAAIVTGVELFVRRPGPGDDRRRRRRPVRDVLQSARSIPGAVAPGGGPEGAAPFDTQRTGFVIGEGGLRAVGSSTATGARARRRAPMASSWGSPLGRRRAHERVARQARAAGSHDDPGARDAGLRAEEVHVVYASANATRARRRRSGGARRIVRRRRHGRHLHQGGARRVRRVGRRRVRRGAVCGRDRVRAPVAGLVEPDPDAPDSAISRAAATRPRDPSCSSTASPVRRCARQRRSPRGTQPRARNIMRSPHADRQLIVDLLQAGWRRHRRVARHRPRHRRTAGRARRGCGDYLPYRREGPRVNERPAPAGGGCLGRPLRRRRRAIHLPVFFEAAVSTGRRRRAGEQRRVTRDAHVVMMDTPRWDEVLARQSRRCVSLHPRGGAGKCC